MQVRHQSPNSRWYSGAGIYRNIWLKVCPAVYLPLDGTYAHTKWRQGEGYWLEIETECAGAVSENTRCCYSLWHKEKEVRNLGWGERFTRGDGQSCFGLKTLVTGLEEWDLEHPVCYRLRVELHETALSGLVRMDYQEITLGLRRMEFTPDRGFFLNGRYVKIHGVCEHHDLGCCVSRNVRPAPPTP